MSDLNLIRQAFKEYFDGEIELPLDLSAKGHVDGQNTGWSIQYVLSTDENKNPFLDFTAEHRMTNFRHHRIDHNGKLTFLETYEEDYAYNAGIPGDKEKRQAEYFEHNTNVSKILSQKGLL
ncbi:MAG: hypothetical protein ABIN74_12855 [Ferruginibacter sp.]